MTINITILTQGSRGDVQPYVALGTGLKKAGYHVRMPAPEVFRPLVDYRILFYTLLLLLMIRFQPGGLLGEESAMRRALAPILKRGKA